LKQFRTIDKFCSEIDLSAIFQKNTQGVFLVFEGNWCKRLGWGIPADRNQAFVSRKPEFHTVEEYRQGSNQLPTLFGWRFGVTTFCVLSTDRKGPDSHRETRVVGELNQRQAERNGKIYGDDDESASEWVSFH
jgi:hypothetical protein